MFHLNDVLQIPSRDIVSRMGFQQIPLSVIVDTISTGLGVSSVLIGAATFLLGLYLSGYEKPIAKSILNLYWVAICSLLIPSILINFLNISVLLSATLDHGMRNYFLIIVTAPLLPILTIFIILFKKFPR